MYSMHTINHTCDAKYFKNVFPKYKLQSAFCFFVDGSSVSSSSSSTLPTADNGGGLISEEEDDDDNNDNEGDMSVCSAGPIASGLLHCGASPVSIFS